MNECAPTAGSLKRIDPDLKLDWQTKAALNPTPVGAKNTEPFPIEMLCDELTGIVVPTGGFTSQVTSLFTWEIVVNMRTLPVLFTIWTVADIAIILFSLIGFPTHNAFQNPRPI